MWLSGLHIPESYLTAIVQALCRRNGWPLDKSTLFTEVTQFQTADELLDSEDAFGYFIQGLYLEGAGWSMERSCLVKQKPKQLIQVSHVATLYTYHLLTFATVYDCTLCKRDSTPENYRDSL